MLIVAGAGILVGATYHTDRVFLSWDLRLLASSDGSGKEMGLKRRECSILDRSSLLIVVGCLLVAKSMARSSDCGVIRPSCRPALTVGFLLMSSTGIHPLELPKGSTANVAMLVGVRSSQFSIAYTWVNCANDIVFFSPLNAVRTFVCSLKVYGLPGRIDNEREKSW